MTTSEKLEKVAQNMPKVYEAGENAASAECVAKHFVSVMKGTDSSTLSFYLPFEPDHLCITGFHPKGYKTADSLALLVIDLGSFAYRYCSGQVQRSTGAMDSYVIKAETLFTKYSYSETGMVTIRDLPSPTTGSVAVFTAGVPYVVTAIKYTDKSMAERITEYVLSLTGSGTATLDAMRVNAAFSEEEWKALIAQRPNWTFALT